MMNIKYNQPDWYFEFKIPNEESELLPTTWATSNGEILNINKMKFNHINNSISLLVKAKKQLRTYLENTNHIPYIEEIKKEIKSKNKYITAFRKEIQIRQEKESFLLPDW